MINIQIALFREEITIVTPNVSKGNFSLRVKEICNRECVCKHLKQVVMFVHVTGIL